MADATLYVSGQTGLVTALDPTTGRKKWLRQTGVEGASGPVAGADALYFSSATGRVVALSPYDGKPLWTTGPQADGLTGEQGARPARGRRGACVDRGCGQEHPLRLRHAEATESGLTPAAPDVGRLACRADTSAASSSV
ncbi:hypothetical protein GCM10009647_082270 [Streptomyces sanglieri]